MSSTTPSTTLASYSTFSNSSSSPEEASSSSSMSHLNHNHGFVRNQVSFWRHFKAVFVRNMLLKKRQATKTIFIFVFPLLALISLFTSPKPQIIKIDPIDNPVIDANLYMNQSSSIYNTNPIVKLNLEKLFESTWFLVNTAKLNQTAMSQMTNLIQLAANTICPLGTITFDTNFTDTEEFEHFYNGHEKDVNIAISLDTWDSSAFKYAIRLPRNSVPGPKDLSAGAGVCPNQTLGGLNDCLAFKYYHSGFSTIQAILDSAIMNLIRNGTELRLKMPNLALGIYPQPAVFQVIKVYQMIPFLLSESFLLYLSFLPVTLVLEKEKRIKDAMYMMGLHRSAYWLANFLIEAIQAFGISVIVTIVAKATRQVDQIDSFLLFLLTQLYALSLIGVGFLISCFFSKFNTASIVGSFVALLSSASYYLVDLLDLSTLIVQIFSFFSPLAFTYSIKCVINSPHKTNFSNLFTSLDFSIGFTLIALVIDCFLYFALVILIDYLSTRELQFSLKDLFKLKQKQKLAPELRSPVKVDIESVGQDLRELNAIHIDHVTKVFDQGKTTAVNDLSLDIYESQITAILGQNGAGKTTLMSMLIGALSPTSGKISIYGRDVKSTRQLDELRTRFGVCFQEDILFDDLTPFEHLQFYGNIKGCSGHELKSEIDRLLEQVELSGLRDTIAKDLSGGEKRKLCILIALIGQSRVIFLDEPTSGVDAYSRHCIWSLLRSYRQQRVIILTTHFMDEADILSDRKAIVVNGQLRCVGSSLFLKNKFGVGYHLRVDLDPTKASSDSALNLVKQSVSSAILDRATNSEILLTLPKANSANFPALFESLDNSINSSERKEGILDYGVTVTTLEDVFLKICYENQQKSSFDVARIQIPDLSQIDYSPNVWSTFLEFYKIRLKLYLREWTFLVGIIFQLVINVVIIEVVTKSYRTKPTQIELNSSLYDDRSVLYQASNETIGNLSKVIHDLAAYFRPEQVAEFNLETTHDKHYGVQFDQDSSTSLLFNKSYYHAVPILQNALANVFGRVESDEMMKTTIYVANHILPQKQSVDIASFICAFMFQLFMASIPPTLAAAVVEDRSEKIKAYLQSNGLTPRQYWMITWLVQCTLVGVIFMVVLIAGLTFLPFASLTNDANAVFCMVLLFLLYTPTSLADCYLLSHIFDKKDTAQAFLSNFNLLSSILVFVVLLVVKSGLGQQIAMQIVVFLCPFNAPLIGLFSILTVSVTNKYTSASGLEASYYEWNSNIIPCYAALILHLALAWYLMPFVDRWKSQGGEINLKRLFTSNKNKKKNEKDLSVQEHESVPDEDVIKEGKLVQSIMANPDSRTAPLLMLQDLSKKYESSGKLAVNSLNLVVDSGQIFGLLGANGAGKTSTMRLIIGEECQTSGSVVIKGQVMQAYSTGNLISYCPQHNPFWPRITLGEYLTMFTTIHGIQSPQREKLCKSLLQLFDIEEHVDKRFSTLSGGTKRKLCMLIAVMANRELTLLDEPSTGMDPKSKRYMWNIVISNFEPHGAKSAILTTHSMEEAEALCTRLAIMSRGSFRCLGNIQHLNAKYGAGYILELKLTDNVDFESLHSPLQLLFPHLVIKEKQVNRIKIDVPRRDISSFGKAFQQLEQLIRQHPEIEDYGLCESSIEQVFIDFAKQDQ